VSLPCLHGQAKTAKVGSVTRVAATDIEDVIVKSVNEHLRSERGTEDSEIRNHSAMAEVIDRI
jgi:site-specific DNA recombinase